MRVARRRFGQHFLHDRAVIERIVEAFGPSPADHVLEIGPGRGALTRVLLGRVPRLEAIEIDRDLAAELEAELGPRGLTVHVGDVLRADLGAIAGARPLRVIGNLPYNVSTPLLFHLLDHRSHLRDGCFMLQAEVVDRLLAAPGTKAYGRLGVGVGAYCECVRLFDVGPGCFVPPPRVWSSVVRLTPRARPLVAPGAERWFAEIVRRAFSGRRKTLRNALRGLADRRHFERARVDPGARGDTLATEDFASLAAAALEYGSATAPDRRG